MLWHTDFQNLLLKYETSKWTYVQTIRQQAANKRELGLLILYLRILLVARRSSLIARASELQIF